MTTKEQLQEITHKIDIYIQLHTAGKLSNSQTLTLLERSIKQLKDILLENT